MPDAYLFDIGNVIITFDFLKAAKKLAPHTPVTAEELLEPSPQARPERSIELRSESEEREDDPFDLPPEG